MISMMHPTVDEETWVTEVELMVGNLNGSGNFKNFSFSSIFDLHIARSGLAPSKFVHLDDVN